MTRQDFPLPDPPASVEATGGFNYPNSVGFHYEALAVHKSIRAGRTSCEQYTPAEMMAVRAHSVQYKYIFSVPRSALVLNSTTALRGVANKVCGQLLKKHKPVTSGWPIKLIDQNIVSAAFLTARTHPRLCKRNRVTLHAAHALLRCQVMHVLEESRKQLKIDSVEKK